MSFVKGYKWTDRQRQECGFEKGVTPWNKGKSGVYSQDVLSLWSSQRKGRVSYFKGKKHSPESIEKLKEAAKHHPNHRGPKGKPWSLARRIAQENRKGIPYNFTKTGRHKTIFPRPVIIGGFEYHSNWHEIRKQVYKRDSWTCQECGVHCHNSKKIQCHHIDYDKANNVFSNLITLCASCHAKSNFKRDDWRNHYKNMLRSRGLNTSEN